MSLALLKDVLSKTPLYMNKALGHYWFGCILPFTGCILFLLNENILPQVLAIHIKKNHFTGSKVLFEPWIIMSLEEVSGMNNKDSAIKEMTVPLTVRTDNLPYSSPGM